MKHRRNCYTRALALLTAALMCIGLAACSGGGTGIPETTAAAAVETTAAAETAQTTQAPETTSAPETTAAPEEKPDTPLVVACGSFSGKFSPFAADTSNDQDVVSMTQISLLTTDRTGGIILNGIEGEQHEYNGTMYTYTGAADLSVEYDEKADITTYRASLRHDLTFSDGEPVTADDIIFNYYVYLDSSYVGSVTLKSYPIIGLTNYLYNNSRAEDVSVTEDDIAALIEAPDEGFSAELAVLISDTLSSELEWVRSLYGNESYSAYTEAYPNAKDLLYLLYGTDAEYDSTAVESEEEVVAKLLDEYGTNYRLMGISYGGSESYFDETVRSMAEDYLFGKSLSELGGGEVMSIEGITKLDEYTVEIRTKGCSASAVYSILGISIAPLHYYGDESLYDCENGRFGFTRGDISSVLAKTAAPLGAGPYRFVGYTDGAVSFEANESYYKGCPETRYVRFEETSSADIIQAIAGGRADAGETDGSKSAFEAIRSYNSDGSLRGDVIDASAVDALGYGYIGLNAETMLVGDDPSSEASKNLRRAFATILAVYRDAAVGAYYGDAASVIEYPISATSWAAPMKTDADYRTAFSVDADGSEIYTDGMDEAERYAAALEAAAGYLKAAGYAFDEASGRFTSAPDGASLCYEILIPGGGTGDHPAFLMATEAKAALETIGIELVINDTADDNTLWNALEAGTQNMWCAAWDAAIDPDPYQIYHSTGIVGRGGSDSNYCRIDDAKLDGLIEEARGSDDQSYRKAVYKDCLDIIIDWAVEIPCYQRQNITVFSPDRVDVSTVTPDITPYWSWMSEIERIRMK